MTNSTDLIEPIGEAGEMPGTGGGFTMATFDGKAVPAGSKLYSADTIERLQSRVQELEAELSAHNGFILGSFGLDQPKESP